MSRGARRGGDGPLAGFCTRSTAVQGRPVAGLFAGVALMLVIQSVVSYLLTGVPAFTARPMGPVALYAYVVGLPILLLVSSASFFLRGDKPMPGGVTFVAMLSSILLEATVVLITGDTTAGGVYILMLIVVGGGYQLRPLGAWTVCGLVISAVALTSAALTSPLTAARTSIIVAALASMTCWILVRSRERHERALHELYEEARVDALTGAATRLALTEWLSDAARTSSDGVGLILLDVDKFKRINDECGHLVGDQVLCHIAQVLQLTTRDVDLVCRFGGDEFGVLLLDANESVTARRAKEVREALAVPAPDLPPLSVSVGAAHISAEHVSAEALDQLISTADARLFAMKVHEYVPVQREAGSDSAEVPATR